MPDSTLISVGDFIDLFYKLRQKGSSVLLSKLRLSGKERVMAKWNTTKDQSDFWVIPELRARWNEKITGRPDLEYEDYVMEKYFPNAKNLRMLSVGCGTGARERKFGKYPQFTSIEGIDVAAIQIQAAHESARSLGMDHIQYTAGDFYTLPLQEGSYDIILFNSSLHHFDKIDTLLSSRVKPLLKPDGHLIIFEYAGPSRLQWTQEQLSYANKLLKELPSRYKTRFRSHNLKKRIYRPGLLRMRFIDPSEAIDSASIVPALHKHFTILEEKKVGWDILHILLKDIAHNFLQQDAETKELLSYLFECEDEYLRKTGRSDAVFGVYRKM